MQSIAQTLESFSPDASPIFERLGPLIKNPMLRQVAALDYGLDVQEHLAALKAMRDEQKFPSPLRMVPSEVMALGMWAGSAAMPNYTRDQRPMTMGQQLLTTTFLSICWLRAISTKGNDEWIDDFRLVGPTIELMSGTTVRDQKLETEAASLLAWTLTHLPNCYDKYQVYLGVALLALTLGTNGGQSIAVAPEAIGQLVNWIRQEEQPDEYGEFRYSDGQGPYHRNHFYYPVWGYVGKRLQTVSLEHLPEPTRRSIGELGDLLEASGTYQAV